MRTQIPGKQILDDGIDTPDLNDGAVTDPKLSDSGVDQGSYTKVIVNEKGRVTDGDNPTTLAGYGITDAAPKEVSPLTATTEASLPRSRRLAATPNELEFTDNGEGSTFVLGLADNPIIPGNGSLTLPSGSTAQRIGSAGAVRYNAETAALEAYTNDWYNVVTTDDLRLKVKNTLRVQMEPGLGQFASIKAAIDSIIDASTTNRYVVSVAGGNYQEDPIQMKRYVSVVGDSGVSVLIQANDPDSDLITGANDTSLESVTLYGATGLNKSAVRFSDASENDSTRSFTLNNVRFGANYRYVTVTSTGNSTTVFVFNCMFGGTMPYHEAIYVESANGGGARALLRSCTTRGAVAPLPTRFGYASGTGSEIFLNACQLRISTTGPSGVGIQARDGATIRILSASFRGFEKAIWIENAGAATRLYAPLISMESNTTDLQVDHPGTTGAFNGVATKSKVIVPANTPLSLFFLDPEVPGVSIAGTLNMGESAHSLTNVTDLLLKSPPIGVYSGGKLARGTGVQVTVSSGYGYVRDADGNISRVSFNGGTINLDPSTINYIYVDSSGVLHTAPSEPLNLDTMTIGRVLAGTTGIISLGDLAVRGDGFSNNLDFYLRKAVGPVYVSGSIVSENATTARGIDVSSGFWFYSTIEKHPVARTGITMVAGYRNGSDVVLSARTQVDNTQYSTGSGLVNLSPGYFAKHLLYATGDAADTSYVMAWATAQYATIEEAVKAPLPTPPVPSDASPKIASIIVQQGVDNIVEIIDERPRFFTASGSSGGGTSDHGDLLGLQDDDHLQYLRTDGTRTLTGNLNFGGNNITNVNLVDGLNLMAHGSRHNPQGADPLSTDTAISLSNTTTNTTGVANSYARSDHTHAITGFQPSSTELTSISAMSTNGIAVHSAADTWISRTLIGNSDIVIVNGSGVNGNPTFTLADVGTAGSYYGVTTDSKGRVSSGTTTVPFSAIASRPTTLAGYGITDAQVSDTDLTALSGTTTAGLYTRTGDGTSATRTLTAPAAGFTITNGDGVAGNPTFALSDDLAALEALSTAGIPVRTSATATPGWAMRSLSAPAAGLTITNPAGTAGNFTFALANDLAALEGLSVAGFAARTAADTWASRTIAGTTPITVVNGAGTAGNPTISLDNAGTAGTYQSVTTDQYGRVTAGTNPTTLSGYGITDAINVNQLGANNGVATLDSGGKLVLTQIPAIAISDTFIVANQAQMLALTAEVGDIAVRSDLSKSFILKATPPTVLANWQELLTPADVVQSVNGLTGSVVLNFVTSVSTAQPAAGLTITGGPITSTGTFTFALANDLAGLEGLTGTGFPVRTAADTWTTRSLGAGTGIAIANGDGIAGAPTISLNTVGTASTYKSVTTDAYGRVTAGSNPTTLSGYGITDAQPLDSDLTALANTNTTGLYIVTGVGTSVTRSLASGTGIVVTNGSGSAGNPTFALDTIGTASTYKSVTTDAYGRVTAGTNPTTLAGYGITDAINTNQLAANNGVATLDGTGKLTAAQVPAIAISDTFVVGSQAAQVALTAEVGDVAVRTDLSKSYILKTAPASTFANWQELLTPVDSVTSVNGLTGAVTTPQGTVTSVAATQPAAGLVITGSPITNNGTLVFALANDLAALEGLASTGFSARTGTDTWAARSITSANAAISITNGDGVAGNVSIVHASGASGTFTKVVTDTWGHVTSGSNPTTLGGYGITDAQGLDSDLTALANTNTTGLYAVTAVGTSATRTITSGNVGLTITNGNGVAGNPTITLPTVGTAGTYKSVTTDDYGRITAGTNPSTLAGYGITDAQPLDSDLTALANTNTTGIYTITAVGTSATRSLVAGTGISIANPTGVAGNITIANTGVTSVGLTLPSIFSVTGSPVTTTGTLAATLNTQAMNTVLAGPVSGVSATPTFRTLAIGELNNVVLTNPVSNNTLTFNGTNWINSPTSPGSAVGTIGVNPTGGGTAWTLISGNRYYADFAHNLGTTNIVITVYNVATNAIVIPDEVVVTDGNSLRVTIISNTRTLKVVVVANGQSIAAGGSTPSSIQASYNGVTVGTATTRLNFVGSTIVADAGGGVTNVSIGARFTNYANSYDSPNNADWAVNAFAPVQVDPTYASLNVRAFSQTTEQGVGFMVTIPTGCTIVNFRLRGRPGTAPATANVVQFRIYFRAIPNNGALGAWVGPVELSNIAIPTNTNFQYFFQNATLASVGLTAGVVYQFEVTRRVSGLTGTNLPYPFYLSETTFEFA